MVYIGSWLKDLKHGKGQEFYIDGSTYEGLYENGKKHGFGKYICYIERKVRTK